MKIAKRAEQQNFILNTEYYISLQIKSMFDNHEIGFIRSGDYRVSHSYEEWREFGEPEIRIFADKLAEVKIILENGYYATVAIGKNGTRYYVSI